MRIATPYPPAEVCVLIVPDDCLNRALFDTLISDEGGEARANELEFVKFYEKDREDESQRSLFTVDGISESDFDDSQGIRAAAELRPDVDQIISAIPELLSVITHAQIAHRIIKSGLVVSHRPELSVNTGAVVEDLRSDINQLAKDEIKRRFAASGRSYEQSWWREISSTIYTEAYVAAGVPYSRRLEDITDIELLKRIKVALVRICGMSKES